MSDRYTLEVQNFGPIVDANVEVRPLTVFVGPSNTGKSYLAVLIYALHRSLGFQTHLFRRALLSMPRQHPLRSLRPSDSIRQSIVDWVRCCPSKSPPQPQLPHHFLNYVRQIVEEAVSLQDAIAVEVRRCFGVDNLDDLVRHRGSSDVSHVSFRIPHGKDIQPASYNFHFGTEAKAKAPSATAPGLEAHLREATDKGLDLPRIAPDDERFELDVFMASIVERAFLSILGPIARLAYYLPADRTGVMHNHNVVVGTLVQGATTTGLRPSTDVPLLSGVLADFLDQLIAINKRRWMTEREELALGVEKNILQGTVGVASEALGYPTFIYRPESWKKDLPLLRASSMVSELAPVVLYLRHWVRRGDTFIIEEPEAHLHPAMQAAFARELARLVRAGIRIVITTHSEWLLEQIGNLVRLSSLPTKEQARLNGADVALNPHDVGAWLFKTSVRPKGSKVEETKLDPETGLFPTDYDQVSDALYNEGAHIFNSQHQGSAK